MYYRVINNTANSNILVFYPWLLPTVGRDLYQITKTAQSAPCRSAAFSDSVHNLWIAISRCCHNIILQKSKHKWTKRKGFYLNLALDKVNTIFWHIPWLKTKFDFILVIYFLINLKCNFGWNDLAVFVYICVLCVSSHDSQRRFLISKYNKTPNWF